MGFFRVDSSVWRDVMSWDGGRSGSGAMIVGFRNGNRIVRVSPDIYPPFKGVTTQHYLLWNGAESHVIEIRKMDSSRCSGMFLVEVRY